MQAERLPVMKEPKKRNRSSPKLLVFLFVFFITLLLVLFFQSTLSKITEVEISGQEHVSVGEIGQAAAVQPGDHFFSVSSNEIESRIKSLRMIETVTVSKHFPGKIQIEVKEYPKVAYQFNESGQVEALLADASVVKVTALGAVLDMPILSGWPKEDASGMKEMLCRVMGQLPSVLFADVSEIKPDPTASYPDKIKMYTRSQYEVQTTIGYLPEKMKYMESYIANLRENKVKGGILRLLETDSHTPFEAEPSKTDNKAAAPSGNAGSSKETNPNQTSNTPGNGTQRN
ncbi:FtsQ-type POTRA domain-containing protein [Paenibacillus sp. GD4]|uniref:cell division protein FtsQ/DivIB n=1 Tax=Paenibacillus TaxID=44249 RepID=UPI0025431B42|nr:MULTISPECIES: FtsQ-type POTRA domain-containing protein [Paenibacillus]MDQ1912995.1 FtsQ-type POTRA domain-containing protein [Paenibacillus sp. GD4]